MNLALYVKTKKYILTYKARIFKEVSIKFQEPCHVAGIFSQELITFDGKALSLKHVFWRDMLEKHIFPELGNKTCVSIFSL